MTQTSLSRPFVFVTGKGGVGKTTISAAIGSALAAQGRRVVLCEVGAQHRFPSLYGVGTGDTKAGVGREIELGGGLWATSLDPEQALKEWLGRQLPSKQLVDLLTRSNLFQYFVAAAPGARELVTVTKVWELGQSRRWDKKAKPYDTVVVDLPASGHGLGLLRTARTFRDVARIGPIANQAGAVQGVIESPEQSAVVAVSLPGELPVTETLQLEGKVREELRREVDLVVVNGLLSDRWAGDDHEKVLAAGDAVPALAARVARTETTRGAGQRAQVERLQAESGAPVVTLPFLATGGLTREDVVELGEELMAAEPLGG